MEWLKLTFISFELLILSNLTAAALDTDCSASGDADCATGEVCDTGNTYLCICDAGSSYNAGPTTTNSCFLTKNLGVACTANDECELGDGGAGTVCDSTCKKDCGTPMNPTGYTLTASSGTFAGATAIVACATGYSGTPSPAAVACQAGGTWASPSGCFVVDCGEPPSLAGYSATKDGGTTYDETATVSCDTGNGYTGTPPKISCGSDGSWTAYSGCSQSGGGVDCGSPTASTGYIPGTPDMTTEGGTASVSCDTANGYTGTAASITCQADGTWTAYSGCSASGNGASEIRQTYSFVIVIGSLIIVLMYI